MTLLELSVPNERTPSLFEDTEDNALTDIVALIQDGFGHDALGWGFEYGRRSDWRMNQTRLPSRFTTRWSDLPVAILQP